MERVADIKRRAQTFVKNGQWDNAIRAYERLAESAEPDPYLHILIGDVYLRRGSVPEAVERYHEAIRGYRESGLLKNAVALCKKILRLDHRKTEVLVVLAELNAQDGLAGEAASFYLSAAEEELSSGNRGSALGHLGRAVAVAPTHGEASQRLVELHSQAGNKSEAASELLRMAEALQMAGREELVRPLLERARELDPSVTLPTLEAPVAPAEPKSLNLNMTGLFEAPMEVDAKPELKAAAEDMGEEGATPTLDGLETHSLNAPPSPKPAPAPPKPEAPVAERPAPPATERKAPPAPATPKMEEGEPLDLPTLHAGLPPLDAPPASAYSAVSVRDDAPRSNSLVDLSDILKEFKQSLENQLSPDDGRSHYDMAMAYMEMNLIGDAIAELAAASRDSELRPKCCEMLGQCYLRQGSPVDAQRFLERGLDSPGLTDAQALSMHYHLALSHQQQGDDAEALRLLEEVAILDPDFLDVRTRLEDLRMRRAS